MKVKQKELCSKCEADKESIRPRLLGECYICKRLICPSCGMHGLFCGKDGFIHGGPKFLCKDMNDCALHYKVKNES